MRRFLLCIALVMGFTAASMAQRYDWKDRRNSLSISVGSPSFLSGTTGFFNSLFRGGEDEDTQTHIYGTYGIYYGFNATKWLRLGVNAFYSGWRIDEIKDAITKTDRTDEIVLLARVDFTYLNCEHVRLYSGLGIGADLSTLRKYSNGSLIDEEGNGSLDPYLGWSVTPIGVEAGGKRLYGLLEVNIGHADLVRAGIGVRM